MENQWFYDNIYEGAKSFYYALNKILNSDWLNTNLTFNYLWLLRSNVRQLNLMSGQWRPHVINVIPFRTQC